MRQNPFVYKFHKGKNVALFNALTLSTIYLSEKQYQSLVKKPPKDLIKANFFVKEDFDALTYLNNFAQKKQINNGIRAAYFLVSSPCNLSCDYCFIENRFEKKTNAQMSEKIAEKGVKLLARNTNKARIIFYGGEPLLNFKAIKRVVETSKKVGLKSQFHLLTNGCLIDEDIADYLKQNNIYVSVSIDGDKKVNDKARKDSQGKGTYKKTTAGMKILQERNIGFGISCTIGKHNMDYQESIFKVVDKFKARGLAFSLIKHASVDKKTRKLMVKNILKTEDKLIKKQISEELIVNRKLIPFIKGKNRFRDCAAYGKQITITPEGKVGICHHFWPDFVNTGNDTYMELDVNYKGKVKNHPTWVEWFNRTPLNMPQCWNCFGIGLCGGGCAKNSYLKKGSIWEIDDDICILVKEALPWVIWKYHEFKFKGKNNKKAI